MYVIIDHYMCWIVRGRNLGNVFIHLSTAVLIQMSDETATSQTLELYLRSLSSSTTGVRLESIIDRLKALVAEGHIADYTITVWGERVSTDAAVAQTEQGAFIHRRIAEFRQWASEHDATLEGGFDTRTVHSSITGETHEFVPLPSVALAARRDGDLEWVVPSSDDAGTTTAIDRLESITSEWQEPETVERVAVPSDD